MECFITSIPFSLALIASTYDQDEILFSYLIILPPLIYAIGNRYCCYIIPSPIAVYCAIKYIDAFYLGFSFCSNYFNTRHSTYTLLTCHAQTFKNYYDRSE